MVGFEGAAGDDGVARRARFKLVLELSDELLTLSCEALRVVFALLEAVTVVVDDCVDLGDRSVFLVDCGSECSGCRCRTGKRAPRIAA